MKKILIVTSVASMADQFMIPSVTVLQKLGYTVHVACNFAEGNTCSDEHIETFKEKLCQMKVNFFHIDFKRDVKRIAANRAAYRVLNEIIAREGYTLIHCHSPIGGVLGRLAAKRHGIPVIYTAHGFHFFKGAPKSSWLLYFPVEKFLSRFTDMLITINREDLNLAKTKMKAKRVRYVHGVGLDISKFRDSTADRAAMRQSLNIPQSATLLLSVGELNENKNHKTVISVMPKLEHSYHYMIAGRGEAMESLIEYAHKLGVEDRVHILGFRDDVDALYKTADIYIHPSRREGLSMATLEAMASGLPVIASKIRGPMDLIDEPDGGLLCPPDNPEAFLDAIKKLDTSKRAAMREHNAQKVKEFSIESVMEEMRRFYSEF